MGDKGRRRCHLHRTILPRLRGDGRVGSSVGEGAEREWGGGRGGRALACAVRRIAEIRSFLREARAGEKGRRGFGAGGRTGGGREGSRGRGGAEGDKRRGRGKGGGPAPQPLAPSAAPRRADGRRADGHGPRRSLFRQPRSGSIAPRRRGGKWRLSRQPRIQSRSLPRAEPDGRAGGAGLATRPPKGARCPPGRLRSPIWWGRRCLGFSWAGTGCGRPCRARTMPSRSSWAQGRCERPTASTMRGDSTGGMWRGRLAGWRNGRGAGAALDFS